MDDDAPENTVEAGADGPAQGALARALTVGLRAAGEGFDWPDASGPLAKIAEELRELEEAVAGGDPARVESELGDLLFAATNAARHLGVDPAAALEGTVTRFERRFSHVAASLAAEGRTPAEATLAELERRWQAAKRGEASGEAPESRG